METYVVLLRGINVGGRGKLPMTELRELLAGLEASNVSTYIQSGNVVFDGDQRDWAELIAAAIEASKGFRPRVLVIGADEFRAVVADNPFPTDEPKAMHLYFLAGSATEGAEGRLEAIQSAPERFLLSDRVLYLHTPKLLSGSLIAPKAESALGVAATQRNWRTVSKLVELLDER